MRTISGCVVYCVLYPLQRHPKLKGRDCSDPAFWFVYKSFLLVCRLACLRAFAKDRTVATDYSKKSLIRLSGGLCRTSDAWAKLSSGKLLLPHQLSLFIALDGEPHTFLLEMVGALQRNHRLSIGLVIVRNGRIVIRTTHGGDAHKVLRRS